MTPGQGAGAGAGERPVDVPTRDEPTGEVLPREVAAGIPTAAHASDPAGPPGGAPGWEGLDRKSVV